ncbi:MAG: superoxide dismutase family protein [Paracoccaceae bacterium]
MLRTTSLAALVLSLPFSAVADDHAGSGETTAVARMQNAEGEMAGVVEFTQTPNGVLVVANLINIVPGNHGFHLHETGDCGEGFQAAGEHYDPTDKEHGFKNENGPHAGDLPNIAAAEDGDANAEFFATMVSLEESAEATLMDDDGSAVIVHASADSYLPDYTGGDRIACGVIEMVE